MKIIALIIVALLIGCQSATKVETPEPAVVLADPIAIHPQPTPIPVVPQDPQPKADGNYITVTLPCKCGDFLVYVPGSCPCFDAGQYPDLALCIDEVYAWCQTHDNGGGKKVVGKYECMLLECGCTLQVFVPDSLGCLKRLYPDLNALLTKLYTVAASHKGKP